MFEKNDLINYSNWVNDWCTQNKYKKTTDGAKPYGLGETLTDNQLFELWATARLNKSLTEHINRIPDHRISEYGC